MSNDEKSSLIFEDTREDLFLSKKMAAEEPAVRRLYWVWRRDDGVWGSIFRSAKVGQIPYDATGSLRELFGALST